MKTSAIYDVIKYLISPEETWDNSMGLHTRHGLKHSLKLVFWYVQAILMAMGLCLVFR